MKFKLKTSSTFKQQAIRQRSDQTSLGALYKASAYLRTSARRSIRKSGRPAQPGRPPHTYRGQLKRSILFAVDKKRLSALIGPSASLISDIAKYHEFGGVQTSKGERKVYVHHGVGPIDFRPGYTNPTYSKSKLLKGRKFARVKGGYQGVVFAKLKTAQQVQRATFLDRQLWSDQSLVKKRRYPRRPFMGPALQASASQLKSIFRVSLSPATSL